MEEFTIDIEYKGKICTYTGQLAVTGYTHRIHFDVDGTPVVLEPDEERNYRAIVAPEDVNKVDGRLIRVITDEVQALLG